MALAFLLPLLVTRWDMSPFAPGKSSIVGHRPWQLEYELPHSYPNNHGKNVSLSVITAQPFEKTHSHLEDAPALRIPPKVRL